MERPEIKDKKVLEYIIHLEKQLANYSSSKTITKSYLGLKNIVDQLNEINIKVKLVVEEVNEEGMTDEQKKTARKEHRMQQQQLEKAFEMVGDIEKYNDMLERMEKRVNPEMMAQIKTEQESGSVYEEALKGVNENK
jgi:hypothetical protein